MLRKFVCAGVIVAIGLGVAVADDFTAIITKVDGSKVTFAKATFNPDTKKMDKGDSMTLPVKADAKITKGKFNQETKKMDAGDPIENGLKNEQFTNVGEKGVFARITTDADNKNITAITTGGFGGKFKKKKDAN